MVSRDTTDPRDIRFETRSDVKIPEDQLALQGDVARALGVLWILFQKGDPKFERYFRPLLSLTQVGLVGEEPRTELARRALVQLKEQVVLEEGGAVKNRYMRRLGVHSLIAGVAFTGLAIGATYFAPQSQWPAFLLLLAGCMAGVWLSFGIRKQILAFEELPIPEEDRLEPVIRLAFAGLCAVALGLAFATQLVVVKLGDVQSSQFIQDARLSLLLGIFSGLSEKALSTSLAGKAAKLMTF